VYQQLHLQVIRQVAQNPASMSTQKKLRLDLLFGGDGLAGRAYSWSMATAIAEYNAERSTGSALSSGSEPSKSKAAPSKGLSKIKTSVTNAA
jgi:hypothetical protein